MKLLRLTFEHATEYRALMLEAYANHPDAFTSSVAERARLPIAWWEERLRASEPPRELVLGCFSDGVLCGVTGLSFESREKTRHKVTLFGLYVPSQFRGNGLGSLLIREALDYARTRTGVLLVQLTVTSGNSPARLLYERHGFVPFGLEPMAVSVGPTFITKCHMWHRLEDKPQ